MILKQTTFLFTIYIFVCIRIIKHNLDKPTKLHKKKKLNLKKSKILKNNNNNQKVSAALVRPGGWTTDSLRSSVLELVFLPQRDRSASRHFPTRFKRSQHLTIYHLYINQVWMWHSNMASASRVKQSGDSDVLPASLPAIKCSRICSCWKANMTHKAHFYSAAFCVS